MMRAVWFATGLLMALPAMAQNQVVTENSNFAELRTLDTLTGVVKDLTIKVGQTLTYERLTITVKGCRYPKDNPNSDAFAYLIIQDIRESKPRFDAWMIASSPALSALEHPRYDVWLLRCKIPEG
jgi:hypothetical protein